MKRRKYYYNHPFPIDTMRNWLKYKDYHYITWKGHFTIKELYDIKLQPKRRHWRSFICCRLPKMVGNRVVYRIFKATVWYKEPNTKYRREEKYCQEEAYQE